MAFGPPPGLPAGWQGVQSASVNLALVASGRGPNSIFPTDPYDPSTFSDAASVPSYTWHWRATLPTPPPLTEWICVYTSLMLRATGMPIGGLFTQIDMRYSFNGVAPEAGGSTPHVHYADEHPVAETGSWIFLDGATGTVAASEEVWLTEAMIVLPYQDNQKTCVGFDWLDPRWRLPIGDNTGYKVYYTPPFPTSVDIWYMAPAYWRDGSTDRNLEAVWTVADQRVIVVACSPPRRRAGEIFAGRSAPGVRRLPTLGRPVRPHDKIVGTHPAGNTAGWSTTGATWYNDPPPGAGNLSAPGYHFAELGTARRTDGGATGVGWLAKLFGLSGELPMGTKIDIEFNGLVVTADKQDRGYGQGGDGITSDSSFAIDLYDGSGSGLADLPGDLGFKAVGEGSVKVRLHSAPVALAAGVING